MQSHEIVTHFPREKTPDSHYPSPGPTDTPVFAALARGFQQARPDIALIYREIGSRELYEQAAAANFGRRRIDQFGSRLANQTGQRWLCHALHIALRGRIAFLGRMALGSVRLHLRARGHGLQRESASLPRRHRVRARPCCACWNRNRPACTAGWAPTILPPAVSAIYWHRKTNLASSNFWGLANAMGEVNVQLYSTSAAILDDIEQGKLDLGYNVLGSYALARQAAGHPIGIVIPQDYVLVLARSALIARSTTHPDRRAHLSTGFCRPRGKPS